MVSWTQRLMNLSSQISFGWPTAINTGESGPEIHSDANSSDHDTSTSDLSVNRDQRPGDSPGFFCWRKAIQHLGFISLR